MTTRLVHYVSWNRKWKKALLKLSWEPAPKNNLQFVEYYWGTEGFTFPISTLISLNPRSTFSCHLCMHQAGLHWGSLPYTAVFGNSEWGQYVLVPMLHCLAHDFPPPDSHYTHERRASSLKLGISALQYLKLLASLPKSPRTEVTILCNFRIIRNTDTHNAPIDDCQFLSTIQGYCRKGGAAKCSDGSHFIR